MYETASARRAFTSFVHEQADAITLLWVLLLEAGAEDRKTATQALRALAAMWPFGLNLVNARAAHGLCDQIGTVVNRNPFEDFRLCEKRVWVFDGDRVLEEGTQKLIHAGNHARMRRPRRTRSDDVLGNRQVHADDTVLIQADPAGSDDPGDHGAECNEEKRAGALRVLDRQTTAFGHPHGDVQHAIASSLLERSGQSTLPGRQLGRGVMADQHDPLSRSE